VTSALAALLTLLSVSGTPALAGAPGAVAAPRETRVDLTDTATGRIITTHRMREGERAVLEWRNSLFGVDVTEVFVARAGGLVLTSVTFADPAGGDPPLVRPEDVDDLYHTGGPFRAEGLSRPVRRVVFRVGEIGKPRLRLGERTIRFVDEVGFGGAIRLDVTQAGAETPPARAAEGT
jgi:hypothetical protein